MRSAAKYAQPGVDEIAGSPSFFDRQAVPADYDGDDRTDVAVFRGGTWYFHNSTVGLSNVNFGFADDRAVPAVYIPQLIQRDFSKKAFAAADAFSFVRFALIKNVFCIGNKS